MNYEDLQADVDRAIALEMLALGPIGYPALIIPGVSDSVGRGANLITSDLARAVGQGAAKAAQQAGQIAASGVGGFGSGLGKGIGEDPVGSAVGFTVLALGGVVVAGALAWLVSPRIQRFRYGGL